MALSKGLITDVIYFYELTEERRAEAEASAKKFGFTPHFNSQDMFSRHVIDCDIAGTINCNDRLWVPSINDMHPDHKQVNIIGRRNAQNLKCELIFYTIDMNCFHEPLNQFSSLVKKDTLLELFPSQAALFENEKYFLFEGYSENEFKKKVHYPARGRSAGVTLGGYNPPLTIDWPINDFEQDEAYLNSLIVRYYNVASVDYIAVHNKNKVTEFYA